MEPDSEIDKFFKDLPSEDSTLADIFGATPAEDKPAAEVLPEKEPRKNHAHRRLEKQLAEEREKRIQFEALATARAEVEAGRTGEVDPLLTQMYGENTAAITAHSELLQKYAAKAKEEALREVQEMFTQQSAKEEQFGNQIDEGLENLEDKHNIDLTSDTPQATRDRTAFLKLVAKLAPKDEDGNLKDYPDFEETYEMFKGLKEKNDNTRAKEIASRTMQKTATANDTVVPQRSPGFRGWQRDMRATN